MICRKTKPANAQADTQTTSRVDVTNLTSSQRRQLFVNCMNQRGFTGFTKISENQQTYYTFYYRGCI